MDKQLAGRVAVITAAGSGMGRQSALRFAEEGATVIAIDIDESAGASLEREIADAGSSATFMAVDLSDLTAIQTATERIRSEWGRLDVLFNHVGVPGPRDFDFDAAGWQRTVDLNLTAPVFLTKEFLPLLRASEFGGSIIFTSSTSGLVASPNSPLYSTVKAGVIGFMRSVAAMNARQNVRANAICPGTIDTPMRRAFFADERTDAATLKARLESIDDAIPMGRPGLPGEIAELALFLAGDGASYITGAAIPADGGYTVV